jgi:hypothetical protein
VKNQSEHGTSTLTPKGPRPLFGPFLKFGQAIVAGMSQRTKLEENYRPDVRARPRLPHGRGFTHGRVFTVRGRKKKIKKKIKLN